MSIFHTNIIRRAFPFAAIAAIAGCEKPKPRVYLQPKELPPPQQETPGPGHGEEAPAPQPRVTYKAPAAWKDAGPDRLSIARFSVSAGGGAATVNVTPLPSMDGHDTELINMWRGQVGQTQLSSEEAAKALAEVDIGGEKGRQFEITGSSEGKGLKIVTAYAHRGGRSWFFKLQGDSAAVEATKPAFAEFLKTVKFEEGIEAAPPPPPVSPEPPAANSANSEPAAPTVPGEMPAGWTAVAPGPMQAIKFNVPEKDGAKAEVTVSIFPGDTGGNLGNVKRWRGQLGLPAADDAEIQSSMKPLEGMEGAVIVDLENAGRAMTGAIVPRGGLYYFYKLTGGTPAVSAAREAFVGYVKAKP